MQRYILFFILLLDVLILFAKISDLSISYSESLLLETPSFLQFLINFSFSIFGKNDYALRLPMILMHISSVVLLFKISEGYLKHFRDRLWLVVFFILLPGVISSALIVNNAGVLIFGLLLYVYVNQQKYYVLNHLLAFIYLFINPFFTFLFLSLIIQNLKEKAYKSALYQLLLLLSAFYMYKTATYGVPEGHFLDVIGIYASIFTPIVFIFIFYALYRTYLSKNKELTYYLASTTLMASLFLSFRQKIPIEYFAPYLITSLPLSAQIFMHSYRIRLKMFRKRYKLIFIIALVFLLFNTFLVLFNKELYLFIEQPKHHFAYDMQIAKEISQELHKQNIECVDTDKKLQKRLKFYKITKCKKYLLKEGIQGDKIVTVRYKGILLYSATVTKINN